MARMLIAQLGCLFRVGTRYAERHIERMGSCRVVAIGGDVVVAGKHTRAGCIAIQDMLRGRDERIERSRWQPVWNRLQVYPTALECLVWTLGPVETSIVLSGQVSLGAAGALIVQVNAGKGAAV